MYLPILNYVSPYVISTPVCQKSRRLSKLVFCLSRGVVVLVGVSVPLHYRVALIAAQPPRGWPGWYLKHSLARGSQPPVACNMANG